MGPNLSKKDKSRKGGGDRDLRNRVTSNNNHNNTNSSQIINKNGDVNGLNHVHDAEETKRRLQSIAIAEQIRTRSNILKPNNNRSIPQKSLNDDHVNRSPSIDDGNKNGNHLFRSNVQQQQQQQNPNNSNKNDMVTTTPLNKLTSNLNGGNGNLNKGNSSHQHSNATTIQNQMNGNSQTNNSQNINGKISIISPSNNLSNASNNAQKEINKSSNNLIDFSHNFPLKPNVYVGNDGHLQTQVSNDTNENSNKLENGKAKTPHWTKTIVNTVDDGNAAELLKSHSTKLFIFVALWPFEQRTSNQLSFRIGDRLLIGIEYAERLKNQHEEQQQRRDASSNSNNQLEWALAFHEQIRTVGIVPSQFIVPVDSLFANQWFHGSVSRRDAERSLMKPGFERGAFLVRDSETCNGLISLSIRDCDHYRGEHIKHYKIRMNAAETEYYITHRRRFAKLEQLVEHYSQEADGLCAVLNTPASRPCPITNQLDPDVWEIPRDSLNFLKRLGSGNFGDVWQGKWNNTVDVAIKTLRGTSATGGGMTREDFLRECNIMKRLRHERLVSLYACCTDGEPLYIVTELCSQGSLLLFLRDETNYSMTANLIQLIEWSAQIASGMAYLEREKSVHRDLAARNILVCEHCDVKIADFGLARLMTEEEDVYMPNNTNMKVPIKWTAPEALYNHKFSTKSDVWSYGILLVEIFSRGRVPYSGMSNQEVTQSLRTGMRHDKPQLCPDHIYHEIMLKCWDRDPEKRHTFDYLHSFFEGYSVNTEESYRDASVHSVNLR
ncbi:hypothetical protein SNEBB_011497 [Seison nebaliae]|nr:hypothetical protein SNEBB_011497 [Seison nebaliae]